MEHNFLRCEVGQGRLLEERRLLKAHYPMFEFDVDVNGVLFLIGEVGGVPGLRARYQVLVVLPQGYGAGVMPDAYVVSPEILDGAPHLYENGSLCLDLSVVYRRTTSLVTFLDVVMLWLSQYEHWIATGERW